MYAIHITLLLFVFTTNAKGIVYFQKKKRTIQVTWGKKHDL